jgi:hypothetical protein
VIKNPPFITTIEKRPKKIAVGRSIKSEEFVNEK